MSRAPAPAACYLKPCKTRTITGPSDRATVFMDQESMEDRVKKLKSARELEAAKRRGLALVDFGAPWCAPCSLQEPIMRRLADRFAGRVCVGTVNIDQSKDVASDLDIHSIPTLILFRDNKEVERFLGLQPEGILSEALLKFLK